MVQETEPVKNQQKAVVTHDPLLCNTHEAGKILGLSHWQVKGLIANDELSVVRVGTKIYLRRASLPRWAERAEDRYKTRRRRK